MFDDVPEWRGQSYYGREQLKPAPFNNWVVGGYIFLAGLGGKVSLLTGLADLIRPPRSERGVLGGRYLPALVPTLGAGLLIYDLHTPRRFYNMFRVAKGTSPMSIGTWVLSGYSVSVLASAALQFLSVRLGRSGLDRAAAAANIPAALLGAGMGTYTASLLAATSTPLWAAAPRALAARFASASFASAAATLSLLEEEGPTRRALDATTGVALATEALCGRAHHLALRRAGIADALGGGWEKVGAIGIGGALPLSMLVLSALGGGRGNLSRVASALALGGALLLRVSILQAGGRSAADPSITLRFAQPDNLQQRRRRPRRVKPRSSAAGPESMPAARLAGARPRSSGSSSKPRSPAR